MAKPAPAAHAGPVIRARSDYPNPVWERMRVPVFLLPALAVYAAFVLVPIVTSFFFSTLDWQGVGKQYTFVGLRNFRELLGDPVFWKSLRNNLTLVVASLGTQLPLGLGLALLLNTPIRGVRLFRTIYFLPLLMSTVAVGILWTSIYNPAFGVLNSLLAAVGLGHWQRGWLGEESTALWAVIATICWQFTPFYMILFRAALMNIPEELYEAARIDGCAGWQLFRYITVPLLRGTIRTAALLSLIGSLKYFDLVFIMTGGGPNHATELMATYMYSQAFWRFRMGYASAIAVMLFLIAFTITTGVLIWDQRRERKVRA